MAGPRRGQTWPTAVVALGLVLFAGVVPLVEAYTPVRREADSLPGPLVITPDPATSGRRITLAPAPGWWAVREDESPSSSASLVSDGGSLAIRSSSDRGTCGALPETTNMVAAGPPTEVVTLQGVRGTLVATGSANSRGLVFVVCLPEATVVVTGEAPLGASTTPLDEVLDMMLSVRVS